MNRTRALAAALIFAAAMLITSVPREAAGQTVNNPKRLRTKKETASRGRTVRDPRRAKPGTRQPARPRALIPSPEPHSKGGRGYVKRGDNYYRTPRDIRMGGNPKRHIEGVKIPHPNKKLR